MTEKFTCDYDPDTELTVQADPDGFVEITTEEPPTPLVPGIAVAAYLTPETARRFARAITLASFAVEGEDVSDVLRAEAEAMAETMDTGAPSEPCPETDERCDPLCSARAECGKAALEDLFRSPVLADFTDGADVSPGERFLCARELAGPAASLDDVLKLARYLEE
ncbi:hypothetical protein WEB32_29800 [Streptomyces netropsis]|uniref:hypothetical protein n=1 Tax=Streptomyces netropsis TaxID=55404 RepID=UPI0030D485CE